MICSSSGIYDFMTIYSKMVINHCYLEKPMTSFNNQYVQPFLI